MTQSPVDKSYRLTRNQLYDLVWSRPLSALAVEFGISANALAKICDRLLVPHPPRGHWSSAVSARRATAPPLAAATGDCPSDVMISQQRAPSRRSRTRLSLPVRRDQIAAAAAQIVIAEGVNAASMKRVAREVGISEALGYTYFPNQTALLVYIAHREQARMNEPMQVAIDRNADYVPRSQASIASYLDYVEETGPLLQILLNSAEVRRALQSEHQTRRAWARQATATHFSTEFDVDLGLAVPATLMFRAVSVRAGAMLARRKLTRPSAERLANTVISGAREAVLSFARQRGNGSPY